MYSFNEKKEEVVDTNAYGRYRTDGFEMNDSNNYINVKRIYKLDSHGGSYINHGYSRVISDTDDFLIIFDMSRLGIYKQWFSENENKVVGCNLEDVLELLKEYEKSDEFGRTLSCTIFKNNKLVHIGRLPRKENGKWEFGIEIGIDLYDTSKLKFFLVDILNQLCNEEVVPENDFIEGIKQLNKFLDGNEKVEIECVDNVVKYRKTIYTVEYSLFKLSEILNRLFECKK